MLGFPAMLLDGDSSVFDRLRWAKNRLPVTRNDEQLLGGGCASTASTIGASRRRYRATDPIGDTHKRDSLGDFKGKFDGVVCCEAKDQIIDDDKLLIDLYACLKAGGDRC